MKRKLRYGLYIFWAIPLLGISSQQATAENKILSNVAAISESVAANYTAATFVSEQAVDVTGRVVVCAAEQIFRWFA